MDVKLRSQAAALRTAATALRSAREQNPVEKRSKKAEEKHVEDMEALRSQEAQLTEEAVALDARVAAVEAYRSQHTSQWGSSLPQDILVDVISHVGWGKQAAVLRLEVAGWCSAHDLHCPAMKIRGWAWPDGAADTLRCMERVSTVVVLKPGYSYGAKGSMAMCLPALKGLPSLTSLELGLERNSLTKAGGLALGTLTGLTSLTLVRHMQSEDFDEDFVYGGGDMCDCGECGYPHEEDVSFYLGEIFARNRDVLKKDAKEDRWKWLSQLSQLTSLDLSRCQNLTAKTLKPLSQLTALTSLELGDEIDSFGGEFDDGEFDDWEAYSHYSLSLRAFKALGNVSSLTSLKLSGCARLTDKGLAELARLPALTSLHLTDCFRVTAKGLTALKTAVPDLVVV